MPSSELTNTFGLPKSLQIPIAAKDVASIRVYVGDIADTVVARSGRTNALKVKTRVPATLEPDISLWGHPRAEEFLQALYPDFQLWVHVDYSGYRKAWGQLEMPLIPSGHVLDHLSNRKATRERGYFQPYIRLTPVSREVNSNAGHQRGGEGLEREYMLHVQSLPEPQRTQLLEHMRTDIVYADPMDLTKMLNVPPGTHVLEGVREMQKHFYPS